MQDDIGAGQVAELQRTDREVAAESHGLVNFFGFVAVHDALDSFVHQDIHQAGNDKTGVISGFAGLFADGFNKVLWLVSTVSGEV